MTKKYRIAGLLFLSGFCALVYQTVWFRELRLIMGASTPATATVLAIFMGGLGMGGLLLGKRADRVKRPLAFYATLELGIALCSAVTPFLLDIGRSVYLGIGGTLVLGTFAGTLVRIIISVFVFIMPTFLMGGTLPAAARAARSDIDISNRNLALLYGANTLGAVTGAVLSTFHLIEAHGNRRTLWIACLINLIVFIIARSQSRKIDQASVSENVSDRKPVMNMPGTQGKVESIPASEWLILSAAAITGLVFFLMELVWYRMLAPILGGTTYTFGIILSVALLGIGAGGILYSSLKSNRLPSLSSFAWTCVFEAFFLVIPFALGDRVAELALVLRTLGYAGFWGYVFGWGFITFVVVFPVALIAGYQFPLLISLLNPDDKRFARKIGLTYGFNTAGSIAGSLLGGFGLLPLLTAPGVWKFTTLLLLSLALITTAIALRRRSVTFSPAAAFFCVVGLSFALTFTNGPTTFWRHTAIGAGRGYPLTEKTPFNQFRNWKNGRKIGIINEWDGVESSVALSDISGLAFLINGKSDGHTIGDSGTQIMAGLLAAILHNEPKTAFVIGLGTGSTAGWLGKVPSMDRVDVAEIEPVIKQVAKACEPVNQDVLSNPKVNVIIGDGREFIMSSPKKYDIIASEPSNPYRAGISSLFTLDYYKSVAAKLNPGGIFVHWVQTYEIDSKSLWTIYSTLSEVFPYVETWLTLPGDMTLIASLRPFQFDIPGLRERLASQPYRDALKYAWHVDSLEGFLARRIAGAQLAQKIHSSSGEINTDDRNRLEFDLARSVGVDKNFSIEQIYIEGRKFPDFSSPFAGKGVDRTEIERKRLKLISFPLRDKSQVRVEEWDVKSKFDDLFTKRAWSEARQLLRSNNDKLPFNTNRALLPIIFIETGDPKAEEAIANHHAYSPEEAIALQALYYAKGQKWNEALASSLEFLETLHKNPWPSELVVDILFSKFTEIAQHTKDGSAKLIGVLLERPFAVHVYNYQRYVSAFSLIKSDKDVEYCDQMKKNEFYAIAGNIEYLNYMFNCSKEENSPFHGHISKIIRQEMAAQSLSFGQIMENSNREAQ